MNETITILDHDQCWHGDVSAELSTAIYAALAADPVELVDLKVATGRYCRGSDTSVWPEMCPVTGAAAPEADQVIDLVGRTAFWKNDTPPASDMVALLVDGKSINEYVPYTVADHWHGEQLSEGWRDTLGERRDAAPQQREHRVALYDQLCQYLVANFDPTVADGIADLHKQWMLREQSELGGKTPREVFAEQLDHINADIENQKVLWTATGACPPGVLQGSYAFRFAGLGLAEYSVHYDMTRHLLEVYQQRFKSACSSDDRDERVRFLQATQQEWLHSPLQDYEGFSPRQVINYERMRLPMVASTSELEDCDCPLCRMMFDGESPMFWTLDGSHIDDDPAFSIWNDWLWEIDNASAEQQGVDTAGVAELAMPRLAGGVWQNSIFADIQPEVPPSDRKYLMLFKLGACVGELYTNLEIDMVREELGSRMQAYFDQLRDALKEDKTMKVHHAAQLLIDVVTEIGVREKHLEPKSRDMLEQLFDFQKYFGAATQ